MNKVAPRNYDSINWNCDSMNSMLKALIGNQYGENPEEQLDKIRADKKVTADIYDSFLKFERSDRVIDLGSGTGFLTHWIAPKVSKIWCLDISKSFNNFAKNELKEFLNVECSVIEYGNLSCVYNQKIDKIFSTGVFIHFNFYDFVVYLKEISKVLDKGGLFAFDIANAENLNLKSAPSYFFDGLDAYKEDRSRILGLMNWTGISVVTNLAEQLGFEILKIDRIINYPCCYLLLEKL
ncbi:MAG: class I SAM-dependent methyltransferase [Methanotrichaceae archaeon]|nr:class I SAM-dependent methyltransferase [Methanotrichaceae archaeon]